MEAIELKGITISDSVAIVERLEDALARIEAVLRQREAALRQGEAENARLRQVEAAAAAALADLDALIGDRGDQRKYG